MRSTYWLTITECDDMAKTVYERIKKYMARQKERGLVQVKIWVPWEDVGTLRTKAKQLRELRGR